MARKNLLLGLTSEELPHNAVFAAAAAKKPKFARPTVWKAEDGTRVAEIVEDARRLTVVIDKQSAAEFGAYLVKALPEIYAAFKRRETPEADRAGHSCSIRPTKRLR